MTTWPTLVLIVIGLPTLVRGCRTLRRTIEKDIDRELNWSPSGPSSSPHPKALA